MRNFNRYYFVESFYKGDNFIFDTYNGYAEIYLNPTHLELKTIAHDSYDHGIRFGIDAKGNMYAWIEDILHDYMEKYLKTSWKVRLEHTLGRDVLYLATGDNGKYWNEYGKPKIDYFKEIMPTIKKIEMVSKPYTVMYGADE
jgi:hypothetical protein